MNGDALKQVILRNAFYRDGYKRLFVILMVVIAVNVALAGLIFYKWTHPPKPQYFAMTADGRMLALHKLSDPVVTDDYVVQWASRAATKAFALDFVHWREELQEASNLFTPTGWKWFLDTLKKSNNLNTLRELKMVQSAQVTGAPQIIEKAIVGGHYAWKVKLPLLVTYTNVNKTINQPMDITMIIIRMPVQDVPARIAINNFIADTTPVATS